MAQAAERMRAMRERRRTRGLRELRLVVPDARSKAVQKRVAKQVADLEPSRESEAMRWTESVDFRVTSYPTKHNGLRVRSQVMADKPVTVRRERIGRKVGRLDEKDISRLNVALALVMAWRTSNVRDANARGNLALLN